MKITITFGEILDRGRWDEFCDLRGLNPWFLNEGRGSRDEETTLTHEEAEKLGLLALDTIKRIDM